MHFLGKGSKILVTVRTLEAFNRDGRQCFGGTVELGLATRKSEALKS